MAAIISCGNYIRSLSLSTEDDETLVHVFVSSRLDYCNAFLYGVADGLTLPRLHWLPVQQRVLFRIAVLVYKCLNGLAPSYLADNITVNLSPTSVRVNSVRLTL